MFISDLINGPLVCFSFICFLGGTLYQVLSFITLSKTRDKHPARRQRTAPERKNESDLLDRTSFAYRFAMFRLTVFGRYPVMMAVTTIFHLAVILTPLFLFGHNILLDISIGLHFPSLPESATDFMTMTVLACCLFFLFRRLVVKRVRAITTFSDYMMLSIAGAPFLTGLLAYHHVGHYETMILAHMLSGEIMIMVLPFTKFIHMIYFFINRFILINQNTLGKGGSRVWR